MGVESIPSFKRFFAGYLEAALWSSTDDDGEPLDKQYSLIDLSSESMLSMKKDAQKFWGIVEDKVDGYKPDIVGHDFWLTRNGHGTGFWDGDYEGILGKELTRLSHTFGESSLYVGDDGLLYVT